MRAEYVSRNSWPTAPGSSRSLQLRCSIDISIFRRASTYRNKPDNFCYFLQLLASFIDRQVQLGRSICTLLFAKFPLLPLELSHLLFCSLQKAIARA